MIQSQKRRRRPATPSARTHDPRSADPFPVYDREIRRLRGHLRTLDARAWSARSHCRGWTVKDVVAHLSTNEVYNQACLDETLDQLPFADGLNGWNARGVRVRRQMSPLETRQEWEARQERVRRAWGRIGLTGKILTSVGHYPLRLQVWHLAREYAIHADDIEVPLTARERRAQLRWRVAFGLLAAHEEGEAIDAEVNGDQVRLRHGGREYDLDFESFVAYLTNRPQQLKDPARRRLVRQLGAKG
ncbi:MAG TPA: maleylpyruvate isomerase family mycothiol-dependent enzyme [Candidatus Dormibacteraeota bacterium]|nr:maleylpyruvate isomerase family mycothiol-dependent enzyme [Candidatus Dormibacteraeota bacterium]